MIMDERLEFADAVSVAKTAGSTYNIGDVIDTDVARDLGNGGSLYFVVGVDTEVITAGSAGTIEFLLVSDSTDSIATDGTATIHYVSEAFITDDANANDARLAEGQYPVMVMLPAQGAHYERYLGFQVRVTTTDTTAGAVNAFLTPDVHGWVAYADASN